MDYVDRLCKIIIQPGETHENFITSRVWKFFGGGSEQCFLLKLTPLLLIYNCRLDLARKKSSNTVYKKMQPNITQVSCQLNQLDFAIKMVKLRANFFPECLKFPEDSRTIINFTSIVSLVLCHSHWQEVEAQVILLHYCFLFSFYSYSCCCHLYALFFWVNAAYL